MKAVIVTTKHRGVFFGYVAEDAVKIDIIDLKNPQMCVYWHASVRGVLGLASHGPNKDCRISPVGVPSIQLRGITAVIECSEQAEKAWKEAPWS